MGEGASRLRPGLQTFKGELGRRQGAEKRLEWNRRGWGEENGPGGGNPKGHRRGCTRRQDQAWGDLPQTRQKWDLAVGQKRSTELKGSPAIGRPRLDSKVVTEVIVVPIIKLSGRDETPLLANPFGVSSIISLICSFAQYFRVLCLHTQKSMNLEHETKNSYFHFQVVRSSEID